MAPLTSPSARELALKTLSAVAAGEGSVEELLAASLRSHPHLPRVERAFLLELVQGVKRWEIRLDYYLAQVSRRPLGKLHPLVLLILRLAVYQLFFLDKVPARAAVAEAGRLAQARRLPPALQGYINAVLRRLAATGPPPLPDISTGDPLALSLHTAHPLWLVRRWLTRWGLPLTQAKLEANNLRPPLTIRVNTLKTDPAALAARLAQEGLDAVPCRHSPVGLHLTKVDTPPLATPSFLEGLWLFQDEAAQLAGALLPLQPGFRVAEIGAGRGGKTTHLAERLGPTGKILALDVHPARLRQLAQLTRRWGAGNIYPVQADATQPLPCPPASLDAVVIDAPCSALGIIRRHPEIKTRRRPSDLAAFPPRQLAMLRHAAPALRPGGFLLYITCTTEPEENQEVVAAFLAHHPDFLLLHDPHLFPPFARPFLQPSGFFLTAPEAHNLDGFFVALLQKLQ